MKIFAKILIFNYLWIKCNYYHLRKKKSEEHRFQLCGSKRDISSQQSTRQPRRTTHNQEWQMSKLLPKARHCYQNRLQSITGCQIKIKSDAEVNSMWINFNQGSNSVLKRALIGEPL